MTFSNEFGNHLCQIRIGEHSRSRPISELCSPLQRTRSPFLYGRNLECLLAMHTCEFSLNFLSFEAFEGQKRATARCSIGHFFVASETNEAPHNALPHRSISVNFILLDRLFRQEYRYGVIISPFSTNEKQQARSRTYQSPGTSRITSVTLRIKHTSWCCVDHGRNIESESKT
jgi:hypothetical protein